MLLRIFLLKFGMTLFNVWFHWAFGKINFASSSSAGIHTDELGLATLMDTKTKQEDSNKSC